jgi:hypothetical protein
VEILLGVFVSFLVIVVVSIATVVFVVRALVKRIRRNRNLADAMLRARARFSSGPQRKVLTLRVRLGEALESGQAALDLAATVRVASFRGSSGASRRRASPWTCSFG